MNGAKQNANTGILRKKQRGGGASPSKGVKFSTDVEASASMRSHADFASKDNGYDSDEMEDALASGDALSMNLDGDDVEMSDAAVKSLSDIEQAKRERGRVRRSDGEGPDESQFDERHTKDDPGLSLITNSGADVNQYESNAGDNAECPVEAFNMKSESESGLGHFDGDTFVFRQNQKPIDGEEDAWLDGLDGDDKNSGPGGGLDSTEVWKPSSKPSKPQQKKAKYIHDEATTEEIGRRLVTILEGEETVMQALTRHGSSIREMKAREEKLRKKKPKKRKASTTAGGGDQAETDGEELKQLKAGTDRARAVVEELTELADALLFRGETEVYDLKRQDWIHRLKLERKRPAGEDAETAAKKQRHNYFGSSSNAEDNDAKAASAASEPADDEVMWEYRGSADGAIHGPYTSRQMLEWTSCGYFVGESAVDIRKVGSSDEAPSGAKEDQKTDVDDLLADLDDDDDGDEKADTQKAPEGASWMRSDRVDFSLYI
ncbi:hypothetical protein THAOC_22490 [Thalassiosira oceanica]|uniref:GYF domain-containing protein n=1 Tax=Thalassiosira oceanica TaxID=159749 RepID=K0SFR1_THAOC|nr:hypothetical protein THAOC_22490 [Thalassiosira oceanica]|eukprot:EJK57462.1 hypothetical protein THAOC_22490 [Thalassiosira oceanica]